MITRVAGYLYRAATLRQHRKHISASQLLGVPAMITSTVHQAGEGAKGSIELAICESVAQETIASFEACRTLIINPVDRGLRPYQNAGISVLSEVQIERISDPPPGHSGIKIKAHCKEMLEGYRLGRMVNICSRGEVE